VEWIQTNNSLDIEESDDSPCELSWVMGMSAVSIANHVLYFRDHTESTIFHLLRNFTQNLMLIRCCKNYSFYRRDAETHTSYQRHRFQTAGVKVFKS
jgi:hypothetical protein